MYVCEFQQVETLRDVAGRPKARQLRVETL
jgi:hypothetical protein